ncbi:MAG TPA: cysteine synthase CysM [Planctomycetota bacterium]|nr:cysteine synthase CysM [Planctomycetota bacterium]
MGSIIDLVGDTPLCDCSALVGKPGVRLLAKCEGANPASSVKDRAAKGMIVGAMERGELKAGMRLIEATSGNTGIALAMIARAVGVEMHLAMPDTLTIERTQTMKAFGATVHLIDGGMEAARDWAEAQVRETAGRPDAFLMLNQFANPDNPRAHYAATGPEIWRDTQGAVTHFVSAMGTTGTIMGVSRFLKEQDAAIRVIGCQPTEGSSIPGIRRWPAAYLPKIYEPKRVDRIVDVAQKDAEDFTRRLAREVGLFVGISSGGAAWAAVQVAREIDRGVVVFITCDRGDRYLSSDVFR